MAAWVPTLGLSICSWTIGSITGIGTFKIDPATGVVKSLQLLLICSTILQAGLCAVKISILLFYKRIFVTRTFQIVSWISIAVVSAWGVLFFFLVLLEGDPISMSWTGEGHFRFDTVALGLAQSGTSIALDVAVLLLPIPVLWSLHMRPHKKFGVLLIFWLGAFCCVAAIVRLILLHASLSKVAVDHALVRLQSKMIIFMLIEPNCSIIAACLPCYGALFVGATSLKSIIHSFRTVFTVGSQSSTYSNSSTRNKNGLRFAIDSASKFQAFSDSQVELTGTVPRWPEASAGGHATVHINSPIQQHESRASQSQSPGITVGTTLNVSTTH
ncbi:hypothetical protein BO79DRAFT_252970 [Aspergillus costaricaensis CBS 115574]|uniref:Uncharacterized protein n=1 Tax=Aspergillus costaricaensis CBS 115574 TaxID=1448317 RepID=A0ACD1IJY2_9EURO|nr:hypothetical protein BO79DRAFT_252970 [Aspergillus costaricaensis CBS 115574]RAK90787.1 hypothetical protein BO79DRAFT_252970 [Aspergillus costaricaensis CBS 115574]